MWRSVPQIEAASTSTITSPGPATGSGISSSSSPGPGPALRNACMTASLLHTPPDCPCNKVLQGVLALGGDRYFGLEHRDGAVRLEERVDQDRADDLFADGEVEMEDRVPHVPKVRREAR